MIVRVLTAFALSLACAAPSLAQQTVKIEFDRGRVTLRVQNAPVRAILAEWAKLGGATIVNGERVAGPPLTLELTSVPERQALDIVLRNVSGYMLAPRRAGTAGASTFDRILILPTSAAPPAPRQAAPGAAAFGAPRPGAPQFPRPPGPVTPPTEEPDAVEDADAPSETPQTPTARPGMRVGAPVPFRRPPAGAEPQVSPDENEDQPESAPESVEPTAANPFGVPAGSSATPGVVTPAPQPRQPGSGARQP
jgi:hypothetical protein